RLERSSPLGSTTPRSPPRRHTAPQRQRTTHLPSSVAAGSRSEDQRRYAWHRAQWGDVWGLSRRDDNQWEDCLGMAYLGAPRSAERLHYGGTRPARSVDPW